MAKHPIHGLQHCPEGTVVAEVDWHCTSKGFYMHWLSVAMQVKCSDRCQKGAGAARRADAVYASCMRTRLAGLVLQAEVPLAAQPAVAREPVHSLALGLVGRVPNMSVRTCDAQMSALVHMVATSLRIEHTTACFTMLQINMSFAASLSHRCDELREFILLRSGRLRGRCTIACRQTRKRHMGDARDARCVDSSDE